MFAHFFALPWLDWLLERSQTSSCPRQLQTCAPLMHGRVPLQTKILATPQFHLRRWLSRSSLVGPTCHNPTFPLLYTKSVFCLPEKLACRRYHLHHVFYLMLLQLCCSAISTQWLYNSHWTTIRLFFCPSPFNHLNVGYTFLLYR